MFFQCWMHSQSQKQKKQKKTKKHANMHRNILVFYWNSGRAMYVYSSEYYLYQASIFNLCHLPLKGCFCDCRKIFPAPFPAVQSMIYWWSCSIQAVWRKIESQKNTGRAIHEKSFIALLLGPILFVCHRTLPSFFCPCCRTWLWNYFQSCGSVQQSSFNSVDSTTERAESESGIHCDNCSKSGEHCQLQPDAYII